MLKRRLPVVAGLLLLLSAGPLAASQATTTDAELKRSLDQIVVLLRQLLEQSAQRETATLLLSRIDLAERRVTPLEAELRVLRQKRVTQANEQVGLKGAFQSIDNMQRFDPG